MTKRPKIDIPLRPTDKILELLGWMAVFGIWILSLVHYAELPETIPIHYNAAGKADGFGDKSTLMVLPIISTFLFIGLTVLNKSPHVFNYLTEITEENAVHQYTNATRMIRLLKLIIVLIFTLIVYKTIQHVKGNADGIGSWFLPVTFALIFIPLFYFLINANKKQKTKL